jgi:hypothetical protein
VSGDHVAHKVDAQLGDTSEAIYQETKENLKASNDLVAKHFPNSLVLPNIGNNDGRYHEQAIDEDDKAEYNAFLYDLWFKQQPGNAKLLTDSAIKNSFAAGSYYRVDLTDKVSALVLNTMFYDDDDDESYQGNEGDVQMDWIETNLEEGALTGRKFIITHHVYAGTRYNASKLWHTRRRDAYFEILRDNHK